MTDKQMRKRTGRPHKKSLRSSVKRDDREDNALTKALHEVVENEVRKGDAQVAPDPDQKGEPGSSI